MWKSSGWSTDLQPMPFDASFIPMPAQSDRLEVWVAQTWFAPTAIATSTVAAPPCGLDDAALPTPAAYPQLDRWMAAAPCTHGLRRSDERCRWGSLRAINVI